jgi:2-polyprenyl-6-methoxyphenol hydroxylase-like FAD-dependent oxidoreductase
MTSKPAHAIVIGGSIVGSAVAALLASRFEQVTVLERDALPNEPRSRAGVPQARHVHALLARGGAELESLFPGLIDELVCNGAQRVDVGREIAWLTPAGWGAPFQSGVVLCCATRDLIEWHVRERTRAHANVTFLERNAVQGLLTDSSRSQVVGVRVREGRGAAAAERALQGDLVVDTTGRGSQLADWLVDIGRTRVRETVIDAHMAYASRIYRLDPSALRSWRAAYVQAALPHHRRGGIIFPIEGDRYHLTLLGYADGAPPTDEEGFSRFPQTLRSSILADVLQRATPLTPIVGHRRTENRWRRFDEIRDWPENLVALGDSVCSFDPVYGQGMTTGVLGALALASRLDAERSATAAVPAGFARRMQRRLVSVVRPAWNLSTSEDLRLDTTTGGRLRLADRCLQRYVDRVIQTSTADTIVRGKLLRVMNMLAGPEALLDPRTVARVVSHLCVPGRSGRALWEDRRSEGYSAVENRTRPPVDNAAVAARN